MNCVSLPPLALTTYRVVEFTNLRWAAKVPGVNDSRIVLSGVDLSSRCSVQYVDVAADLQMSGRVVHDINTELGLNGFKCKSVDHFFETTTEIIFWGATTDRGSYIGAFSTNGSIAFDAALVTSTTPPCRGPHYDPPAA